MKSFAIAATAAALVMTASLPAMAATKKVSQATFTGSANVAISPDTLGGANHIDVTGINAKAGVTSVAYDLFFNFTTPIVSSIDAIISNALKSSPVKFTDLKIYAAGFPGNILGESKVTEPGSPNGVTIETTTDFVPAGNYVAEVTGTTTKNVTISANIALTAVPLPGTVALFGTAVLGLGLVGAARRRRSAATA